MGRASGPLLGLVAALGDLLSRCLDRLTPLTGGGGPPRGPAVPHAPSRGPARGSAPPAPAPRRPAGAPVPARELPTLRFAKVEDTPREEDVYEGEEPPRLLPVVWRWLVRAALVGGLVAGGVLAVLRWETWFPRAAEVGQTVFNEIDRRARSRERSEEFQQALGEAAGRLPHLAPETIGLVLSSSEGPLPDPPTVFQLANEAADRGLPALTPEEAAELEALRGELLGHLRPPERARLQDYERARATRAVFPFENPPALELVARGARAMPPPRLERLQAIYGKAVAAGLQGERR